MKSNIALIGLISMLTACGNSRQDVLITPDPQPAFTEPDVQADFCTTHIKTAYCTCAFEHSGCDEISMTKQEANKYVAQQYGMHVATLLKEYAQQCVSKNGYVQHKTCYLCPNIAVPDGSQCRIKLEKDDDVAYHITSHDKKATLTVPEEAIPRNVNIRDIELLKTEDGYDILPDGVRFKGDVTLTITHDDGTTEERTINATGSSK